MKKSEFVSLINSYATARLTNDERLIRFSIQSLQEALEEVEFEPEDEETTTDSVVEAETEVE